ncbi:MAG: hypothetical protein V4672_10010 [Verrucomicrobiota bacterium]
MTVHKEHPKTSPEAKERIILVTCKIYKDLNRSEPGKKEEIQRETKLKLEYEMLKLSWQIRVTRKRGIKSEGFVVVTNYSIKTEALSLVDRLSLCHISVVDSTPMAMRDKQNIKVEKTLQAQSNYKGTKHAKFARTTKASEVARRKAREFVNKRFSQEYRIEELKSDLQFEFAFYGRLTPKKQ